MMKYKHCCQKQPFQTDISDSDRIQILQEVDAAFHAQSERERTYGHLRPLIHSRVANQKLVAVGNKLYLSGERKWKYFNEFLEDYLLSILGIEWFDSEIVKEFSERHIILQWRKLMWKYLDQNIAPEGDTFYAESSEQPKPIYNSLMTCSFYSTIPHCKRRS